MDANDLARYDAMLTSPPDPVFYAVYCDGCDAQFDASHEFSEGDECPDCTEELVQDDSEPCRCPGDTCYC